MADRLDPKNNFQAVLEIQSSDQVDDETIYYNWPIRFHAEDISAARSRAEEIADSWRGGPTGRIVDVTALSPIA